MSEKGKHPQGNKQADVMKLLRAKTLAEQATILGEIFMDSHEEYRLGLPIHGAVKITILMQEVLEKAMIEQDWLLVRQLGGLLSKQLAGLDQAVTDILIHIVSLSTSLLYIHNSN